MILLLRARFSSRSLRKIAPSVAEEAKEKHGQYQNRRHGALIAKEKVLPQGKHFSTAELEHFVRKFAITRNVHGELKEAVPMSDPSWSTFSANEWHHSGNPWHCLVVHGSWRGTGPTLGPGRGLHLMARGEPGPLGHEP